MTHLFVTNDYPPKVGGIQNMLCELWRRLPEGRARIMTTTYPGSDAFDATHPHPIERVDKVLLPTPHMRRRIAAAGEGFVVYDPAHIIGLLAPSVGLPYALIVHGAELSIPARTPGYNLAL